MAATAARADGWVGHAEPSDGGGRSERVHADEAGGKGRGGRGEAGWAAVDGDGGRGVAGKLEEAVDAAEEVRVVGVEREVLHRDAARCEWEGGIGGGGGGGWTNA